MIVDGISFYPPKRATQDRTHISAECPALFSVRSLVLRFVVGYIRISFAQGAMGPEMEYDYAEEASDGPEGFAGGTLLGISAFIQLYASMLEQVCMRDDCTNRLDR